MTSLALGASIVFALAAAFTPSAAYADDWMQVSCVNPNQSGAPSQGWSSFSDGSPSYGSAN
jgi:hypothetical protein